MEKSLPHFNLDAIFDFITYSDANKIKHIETITNIEHNPLSNELEENKSIRENILSSNPQIDELRYDLIKTLIDKVLNSNIVGDNDEKFTLGEQIAINTLSEYKMLN